MRLLNYLLISLCVGAVLSGCDDDDPSDVADDCSREAAFRVDGNGICATGGFRLAPAKTTVTLNGENNETLVIIVNGIEEQRYDIPEGAAIYTDRDGTVYQSKTGGSLDVSDNSSTMDAMFSFQARSSDGIDINITRGVVENLPSQ